MRVEDLINELEDMMNDASCLEKSHFLFSSPCKVSIVFPSALRGILLLYRPEAAHQHG